MKLTIGDKPIAITEGATISIERSSPFLNDDTGSYSFPFPVPTLPNQQALGWPGKLQRTGDIPDQSFILEDSGIQIFRGEVEYDEVTVDEIGIILKSGYTEFTKKMEGKKLCDVDYGSESWIPAVVTAPSINVEIINHFASWDASNVTDNGKYVVSPFFITSNNGNPFVVNNHWLEGSTFLLKIFFPLTTPYAGVNKTSTFIGLQFRVHFVVAKIFEAAGYVVVENSIASSEFKDLILFCRPINITLWQASIGTTINVTPVFDQDLLQYSTLMPDIEILEFLDVVKNVMCIMYEIDELKKEVRIKFKKDVFLPENLDGMKLPELAGWIHGEERALKGFALGFSGQSNDLDTEFEYEIAGTVATTLPGTAKEDQVYHMTDYNRDYIFAKNAADALVWQEIGRLKQRMEGDGENTIEIPVTIPPQMHYPTNNKILECPSVLGITGGDDVSIIPVKIIAITLYHGRKTFGGTSLPFSCFDRFSLDGTIDVGNSLKPAYLYETVYSEFLNWQTYRARAFTKYLLLSLPQLIALQWGKRYMINGVEVIFNKLNYELPYLGQVEVIGFTA